MREAMFYKTLGNNRVVCVLCPKTCVLENMQTGDCRVRKNIEGKLYSLNYGKIIAMHLDPIEKKPLFHFWPGSRAFSIAAPGCNLHCLFCQNWDISQEFELPEWEIEPEGVVEKAVEAGAQGIAYTYSEPTVFYEFAYDTAKLAKKEKLYNVWISNGMINPEPLKKIAKFIDAANIDLKGDAEFYRKVAGGLSDVPVKRTIELMKKLGIWVEVTLLLIPGYNDSEKTVRDIANFISKIDRNIPLHISRFHPAYRMLDVGPTPVESVEKAVKIADEVLNYVYAGNVWGHKRENTYCKSCGNKVIERIGFHVVSVDLEEKGGKYYCGKCGEEVEIVGKIFVE